MTDENVIRTLRAQAWERAKGELRAVAASFVGLSSAREDQFTDFTAAVEAFVAKVEDEGLAE